MSDLDRIKELSGLPIKESDSSINKRVVKTTPEEFKKLLLTKKIRPASLNDVHGTHHKKKLYKHPNTQQYYVAVK
jgi:hypothetical protein